MYDLLITDAVVVDGSGASRLSAHIAAQDGLIVEVGRMAGSARMTISPSGRVLTPAFIDVHTYHDGPVCWDRAITEIVHDLPAGGARLLQTALGYEFTIKRGRVTFQQGEWTGDAPGRLIRGEVAFAARCNG